MQRIAMRTVVTLAMITGVHCAHEFDEESLANRAFQERSLSDNQVNLDGATLGKVKADSYKPPVAKPSLYSQGIMGYPEKPPPKRILYGGDDTIFGGPYKAPVAKPTLYSQGVVKTPVWDYNFKIGKGLIGKGALLGGPYKGPVAKPSLYSQGYTGKRRNDEYWAGTTYKSPVTSEKTFDSTGLVPKEGWKSPWLKMVLGGPYKTPKKLATYERKVPVEAPVEAPAEEVAPAEGSEPAQSLAEEAPSTRSVLGPLAAGLVGLFVGNGVTLALIRAWRVDRVVAGDNEEPLVSA